MTGKHQDLSKYAVKKLIWLIYLLFITPSFAYDGNFYLAGSAGATRSQLSNDNPQITYYYGLLTDNYPLSRSNETTTILGISAGYEFAGCGAIPAVAFGVGFYATPDSYQFNGQLIETPLGDISSTLYNYSFNLKTQRYMFETQLTWLVAQFAPFINAGVGAAQNHLQFYSETPVDSFGFVALPPFESNRNTNFAYQVGVGIGYAFDFGSCSQCYHHERISLGYRYVYSGNASFETRGVDYPFNLKFGKLTSNELYLIYTHLFSIY